MKYLKPTLLAVAYGLLIFPLTAHAQSDHQDEVLTEEDSIEIMVHKRPNCHCCTKWTSYLKEKGLSVTETQSDTLDAVKDHYLVPEDLQSCHTAIVNGYVVEGHVPVESIYKLLKEQPDAQGITVPGMPTGTPGMGNDGTPYEVYLFDEEGEHSLYEKY